MLRYFIAWNLWLGACVVVLLGQGDAGAGYRVFNSIYMVRWFFWIIWLMILLAATGNFCLWWRSRSPNPSASPRGFEVINKMLDE